MDEKLKGIGQSKTALKAEQNLKELRLNMLAGSMCTAFSVMVWNPLDTVRIRWQVAKLQPAAAAAGAQPNGTIARYFMDIARQEGLVKGLWIPGCLAHSSAVAISSGFRLGFYPTIRDLMAGENEKSALNMWCAGFTAGAVGFFLANPFFLAKVRMQTTTGYASPPYRSTFHCLSVIAKTEGLPGLFRGSTTLMVRGALLSAGAQLGYDGTKTEAKRLELMSEGPALHLVASVASAFLASVMSAPCDLIMTRYQAAPILGIQYSGLYDCVRQIVAKDGVFELYRGWTVLFFRLAPLWMFNMPLYEATRRLLGLSYLN